MSEKLTVENRLLRLEKATASLAQTLFRVSGSERLRQRGEYALAELMDHNRSDPIAAPAPVSDRSGRTA